MKKPKFRIIIILVSITLLSAGFVLAAAFVESQNSWDPRVYDPLGIGSLSTTKTTDFYNFSFSIYSNDHATINKILFGPYPSPWSTQNIPNLLVYVNGSTMLKPFNLQGGDNVQANLLVPIVDVQPN